MAITFRTTSSNFVDTNTTITVNKPTGTVDNDIMFAVVFSTVGYANSTPAGWTRAGQITNGFRFELYWKVASSEGANYTWGYAAQNQVEILIATYYGGFNTATPSDVVSNTLYNTSDNIVRAATMTTTSTNEALLFFAVSNNASTGFTKPSVPTTDWVENYDNAFYGSRFEVCSMTWTSSGATGNMDATMTVTGSTNKHAFAIALKPEVSSIKLLSLTGVGK